MPKIKKKDIKFYYVFRKNIKNNTYKYNKKFNKFCTKMSAGEN